MEKAPLFPSIELQAEIGEDDDEDDGSRCCLFFFVCPWNPASMQRILEENGVRLGSPHERRRGRQVAHYGEFPMHNVVRPVIVSPPAHADLVASDEDPPDYTQTVNDGMKHLEASGYVQSRWNFDRKVLWKEMLRVRRKNGEETWWKPRLSNFVAVLYARKPQRWHVWRSARFDYIFGYKAGKKFYYVTVGADNSVMVEQGRESNVIGAGVNTSRLFKRTTVLSSKDVLQHYNTQQYLALERTKYGFRLKLVKNASQAEEWVYLN